MCFSKRERQMLKWIKDNREWFMRQYHPNVKKYRSLKECKRKKAYYRVLKSRIKKKVEQMERDLALYNKIKDHWDKDLDDKDRPDDWLELDKKTWEALNL